MGSGSNISQAADLILGSARTTAFTGAGISVESGIPPFRGEGGLWNLHDPVFLEIDYFLKNPEKSWSIIKQIFYDYFGNTKPNKAHIALAEMEKLGLLQGIITQNIDNLHQEAGSRLVHEFHGNSRTLVCTRCREKYAVSKKTFINFPPVCPSCHSVLKPDFVFFGEPIPEDACRMSFAEITESDLFIVIGTSGEIMPASLIPFEAKKRGKKIIEINTSPTNFTGSVTDIFLEGMASVVMEELLTCLKEMKPGSDEKI